MSTRGGQADCIAARLRSMVSLTTAISSAGLNSSQDVPGRHGRRVAAHDVERVAGGELLGVVAERERDPPAETPVVMHGRMPDGRAVQGTNGSREGHDLGAVRH